MGVVAQQTPTSQILPLVPISPDVNSLWTWAQDLTRTLQQNLNSIARKANDTSTYPLTGDLNAGGFSITGLLNLTLTGTLTYQGADIDTRFVNVTGDTMTGGLGFGSAVAASITDVTRHIALFSTAYGFGITSSHLNYVAPTGAVHNFVINGVSVASFSSTVFTTNGGLTISGAVTGVTSLSMAGALSGVTTISAGSLVTLTTATAPTLTLSQTGTARAGAFRETAVGTFLVFDSANALGFAIISESTANINNNTFATGTTVWSVTSAGAVTMSGALSGATTVTASSDFNTTAGTFKRNGTAIPFVKAFESAQQTITAAGALTLAHGLGVSPKLYMAVIINQTAELGYSIGDEVLVNPSTHGSSAESRGLSLVPDATNINVRYAAGTVMDIINKTTGAVGGITSANWKLVVRAWA